MIKVSLRRSTKKHPAPDRKTFAAWVRRAAELSHLPLTPDWEFAIRFVGDRSMARINREFVGHEGTTDVITFSYFDDPDSIFEGDVALELVVCLDVAEREGTKREDSSFARETALYLVHGMLHASGCDDLTTGARRVMRRREREVMTVLEREFNTEELFPH